MPKVGIVMGSDSDMPVMSKAADILEKLGIDYEMRIISAHREPDVFFDYAVWQHIYQECAQRFSRCRLSEFLCTLHHLGEEIPCIPLYRCHPAFR